MTKVTYEVVRHDEGWAYKVGDVYSGAFPTHEAAHAAAAAAADRQRQSGATADIVYEDADGQWHHDLARGDDRPETELDD